MFGIIIINLNLVSYLRMMPKKAIEKAKKDKKDKYLQACL